MPTAYKNPLEAQQGLTSAFSPTTDAQRAAIANAASLVPTTPTVVTSANVQEKVLPDLNTRLNKITGDRATYTDIEGNQRYSDDLSYVETPIGATPGISGLWESDGKQYKNAPTYIEGDEQSNKLIASMIQQTDAQTRQLLQSIQQQYSLRKTQQEDINKRAAAGTEQALLMGGSSRYAPISSGGIQQAQESYGLQQIAALDAEEQSLIAQAKSAQQSKNFQLMEKALAAAEQTRKEKQAMAAEVSKSIAEQNAKLREQQRSIARDEAVATLVSQGITDPGKLLLSLNEMGGDFTAEEIKKTLDNIGSGFGGVEKLTGETKNFFLLRDMGALPETITSLDPTQQLGAYLQWQKKLTTSPKAQAAGSTPGGGTSFDQFTKEQIALSVVPVQLRNTETELNRFLEGIRSGLAQGLSPYEVADKLTGYVINQPDAFSEGFRQYMSLMDDQSGVQDMARLINSGNQTGAITKLENQVLNKQRQNDPEGYAGEPTTLYYTQKVNEVNKLLNDAGFFDAIGPFEGTFQQALNKFKGKDAQTIKTKITSLVSEMRNHLAGTAVTESERAFLEPLIPELTDKTSNFKVKLGELKNNSLTKYNTVRSTAGLPQLTESSLLNKSARIPLYAQSASVQAAVRDPLEVTASVQVNEYDPLNLGF